MRVLHINCNYIGTTLHQIMIENLTALGCENQVYVPTYDKNIAVIRTDSNVVVSECLKKNDRVLFDYKQKKIMKDIQSKVDVSSFDLIHAYTLFTDGNCAMKLSRLYKIPYVVAIRNTDVNVFLRLMIHLRPRGIEIMQNASAVFFLSAAYRKEVFEKYVPKKYQDKLMKKVHIVPNGIDDFWFQNILKQRSEINRNKKIRLIYAGGIDRNKNILTTQKAMRLLRKKGYDVSLTVVGKVIDKKEFEKVQKDPDTICLPEKPKEELIKIYRQNDIFVMPSFTESFGLVYAEAITQCLPVLYSKGQGFDGQFQEGEVGYSVSAYDPVSVADGIEKIYRQYNRFVNIAGKAEKFKWSKIVEEYSHLYDGISSTEQ